LGRYVYPLALTKPCWSSTKWTSSHIIILSKCSLFSPTYSCKITHLALKQTANTHLLTQGSL